MKLIHIISTSIPTPAQHIHTHPLSSPCWQLLPNKTTISPACSTKPYLTVKFPPLYKSKPVALYHGHGIILLRFITVMLNVQNIPALPRMIIIHVINWLLWLGVTNMNDDHSKPEYQFNAFRTHNTSDTLMHLQHQSLPPIWQQTPAQFSRCHHPLPASTKHSLSQVSFFPLSQHRHFHHSCTLPALGILYLGFKVRSRLVIQK